MLLGSIFNSNPSQMVNSTIPTQFAPASLQVSDINRPARISAAVIACLILTFSLLFIIGLLFVYEQNLQHPKDKPANTISRCVQHIAPFVYCFLLLASTIDGAICAWLLVHHLVFNDKLGTELLSGIRLILFNSCWTSLSAGALMIIFLHSQWTKLPIASIGSQSIWLTFTWILWTAGAGTVNNAFPGLIAANCSAVAQCHHIQTLFAIAVILIVILTVSICFLGWYAWRSVHILANSTRGGTQ